MLLARKAEIRRKLEEELDALRAKGVDITGDSADAAFEAGSDEMTSQLAELDARELAQIDRALLRLKQGTYGLCEVCQGKIPLGRLNALPYSTLCIECQREMERYPNWHAGRGDHAAEGLRCGQAPGGTEGSDPLGPGNESARSLMSRRSQLTRSRQAAGFLRFLTAASPPSSPSGGPFSQARDLTAGTMQ
jgi:DnaK suppressor protein